MPKKVEIEIPREVMVRLWMFETFAQLSEMSGDRIVTGTTAGSGFRAGLAVALASIGEKMLERGRS